MYLVFVCRDEYVEIIFGAHYYHSNVENRQFSTEFKTHEKYKPGVCL